MNYITMQAFANQDLHFTYPDGTTSDVLIINEMNGCDKYTLINNKWELDIVNELPKIGTFMEYQHNGECMDIEKWIVGDKLEIIAYVEIDDLKICVVFNKRTGQARGVNQKLLRPIQTREDKALEYVESFLGSHGRDNSVIKILSEGGFLK